MVDVSALIFRLQNVDGFPLSDPARAARVVLCDEAANGSPTTRHTSSGRQGLGAMPGTGTPTPGYVAGSDSTISLALA